MNSEVPARLSIKIWAYFAVGFTLPLVLTNGHRSKTLRGFSPIDLVFGSSQIYLAEIS